MSRRIAYLKKRCIGNNVSPVRTKTHRFDYEILFRVKSKDDLTENDIQNVLAEISDLLRGKHMID